MEGKALKYEWSRSEQGSLTEVRKEEFEINWINLCDKIYST